MKTLLAIFSCHRYQYCDPKNDLIRDWFTRPVVDRISAIRDTWLKDVTYDYKIIFGRGTGRLPKPDEIFLDVLDDYHHSTDKLRALIRYAQENGYDRLLKIDDDVFVYCDRLIANEPTTEYVGGGPFGDNVFSKYVSGAVEWFGPRAMEILTTKGASGCWAEDRWAGETLCRNGIKATIDTRYHIVPPTRRNQYISDEELAKPNNYISIHSLTPAQMRKHWAERVK